jgi:enoyl-CoA hydratase
MTEEDKLIEYKSEKGIATISLNNPSHLNIFSSEALTQMNEILDKISQDLSVKVVILASKSDKVFTGGANIKEMYNHDPDQAREFSNRGHTIANKLESLPVPVIAAINGYTMGGGVEFICACDIRIASEDAVFAQPEIDIGVLPGWGGTQRLARHIGMGNAKEMIYTGKRITALEALQLGLVNQVVPNTDLLIAANTIAETIASKSRVAIVNAKRTMNLVFNTQLKEGLTQEIEAWSECFDTYDQKEGMKAFLERRKPEFKDK